jgi:hypothetical protein
MDILNIIQKRELTESELNSFLKQSKIDFAREYGIHPYINLLNSMRNHFTSDSEVEIATSIMCACLINNFNK